MAQQEKKEEKNDECEAADFSGVWELTTNENLDNFMKSQGIGWAKRKLMSVASVTLTIDQDNNKNIMKVKAKLPIGEVDEELVLDGSTKETKNPMGDTIKMCAAWKDDKKQILVIKTDNQKTKKKVTMERSMPNINELKDQMTNEDNISMVRTFKRKDPK